MDIWAKTTMDRGIFHRGELINRPNKAVRGCWNLQAGVNARGWVVSFKLVECMSEMYILRQKVSFIKEKQFARNMTTWDLQLHVGQLPRLPSSINQNNRQADHWAFKHVPSSRTSWVWSCNTTQIKPRFKLCKFEFLLSSREQQLSTYSFKAIWVAQD